MSQAKVDRYKEQKKNRKEIVAREKRGRVLSKIIGTVIVAAIVVAFGLSIYYKANPAPEYTKDGFYALTQTDSFGILDPSIKE